MTTLQALVCWIKSLYQTFTQNKENVLAFACGDIMLFTALGIPPEIATLGWKMFSTVLLAIGGGVAGMLGKDLYIWGRKKLSKKK